MSQESDTDAHRTGPPSERIFVTTACVWSLTTAGVRRCKRDMDGDRGGKCGLLENDDELWMSDETGNDALMMGSPSELVSITTAGVWSVTMAVVDGVRGGKRDMDGQCGGKRGLSDNVDGLWMSDETGASTTRVSIFSTVS